MGLGQSQDMDNRTLTQMLHDSCYVDPKTYTGNKLTQEQVAKWIHLLAAYGNTGPVEKLDYVIEDLIKKHKETGKNPSNIEYKSQDMMMLEEPFKHLWQCIQDNKLI